MNLKSLRCLLLAVLAALPFTAHAADKTDPSFANPSHFVSTDGAFLYGASCQGCHMFNGEGASGAGVYPSLARNPRLQSGVYPAYLVVKGHKAMPAFGSLFDDAQVAAVVNYVRTHFGNHYKDPVTPEQVKALRP